MELQRMPDYSAEWLEADGLGGFASGTVGGVRTRRYHALLLTARRPPTERVVLVNGCEVWVDTPNGSWPLSTQFYSPGVRHPDGQQFLIAFTGEPWPTWRWRLPDGTEIEHELFVPHGVSATILAWRQVVGTGPVTLHVRPLLSGRDHHALHLENPAFRFDARTVEQGVAWQPYVDLPTIHSLHNGDYRIEPMWYRQFLYSAEQERGLDCIEDLASPGELTWELAGERHAVWMLASAGHEVNLTEPDESITTAFQRHRTAELARRSAFPSPLHRSANVYLVRRGAGKTLVAGYPWFTDWGRDTFIALRGLCLATGRLEEAGALLTEWAGTVSQGMLPNRFSDHGDQPEFNAVDASLWFVVAVHDYFQACDARQRTVPSAPLTTLCQAMDDILEGYSRGTRYGIRRDRDGLIAAGEPGVQLTWMDAKVEDWVVTPRIGKPVEIQALWLNALWIASEFSPHWRADYDQGLASFRKRFWNPTAQGLFDVVDVDHQPGVNDDLVRPNQIFAVGGLPVQLLGMSRAKQVVDLVEAQLLTPLGLRTLAPGSPGYSPVYRGGVRERDGAYHQGTAWPWLLGPFVEAWVRVRGNTAKAKRAAKERFLPPLMEHLQVAGLGHLSEIVDADPPHTPRGCPFQAWSLGELLRVRALLE
jgi:predicted glycogen debranching enzyme